MWMWLAATIGLIRPKCYSVIGLVGIAPQLLRDKDLEHLVLVQCYEII